MLQQSKASRSQKYISTLELAADENNVFHQGPERDRTWESLQVDAPDSRIPSREPVLIIGDRLTMDLHQKQSSDL